MGWVLFCATPLWALIVRARLQPTPAPAAAATTAATTRAAATRCQTVLVIGGVGGGGGAHAGMGLPNGAGLLGGSSDWSGWGPAGSPGWLCTSDIDVPP